jgi:hypothetical protein
MSAKTEKTVKTLIGLSAVGVAAYLAYSQLTGNNEETIGGSGAFSGLGGGESLTSEGITGTSEGGINYNISLPAVDTSGISQFISGGDSVLNDSGSSGGESIITGGGEIPAVVTKKAATTSGDSTKSETSGSLAQVFGTQAQRTNERGDYYTTAAGGGAGAIKGKSLGEMFIDSVKKVTSSEGVDTKIYTGASTATNNKVSTEGIQAALKAKKEQDQAISQTKIGAYTPVSNPLQALKDSGIVKSTYNPNSSTTTKKEAVTSSSNGSTTKKTISLAEASKGSSRFSSQGTSKKVIKVKKKN